MSATPVVVQTPKTPYAQIATANTARDGSGTLGTLFTVGASGGRIDGVHFVATGTTTAGVLRIFISNDGGTTKRMIGEVIVEAVTPGTTIPVFSKTWLAPIGVLILEANAIVYVSTNNAETFNCFAIKAGNF